MFPYYATEKELYILHLTNFDKKPFWVSSCTRLVVRSYIGVLFRRKIISHDDQPSYIGTKFKAFHFFDLISHFFSFYFK